MFTGLIETVGTVEKLTPSGNYQVISVSSALPSDRIEIGESIACNGACLTVVAKSSGVFNAEISQETSERVDLGRYQVGSRLNLERALQVGARLGGHFVAGHVDSTGKVDYLKKVGRSLDLAVGFEGQFDPLVIDKGSIAIDGVSLTVNAVRPGWLSVNLIPHTGSGTNLTDLKAGEIVNLEFDMIGKYIIKSKQVGKKDGLTVDTLLESGW